MTALLIVIGWGDCRVFISRAGCGGVLTGCTGIFAIGCVSLLALFALQGLFLVTTSLECCPLETSERGMLKMEKYKELIII